MTVPRKILQSNAFRRAYKRLRSREKGSVDAAVSVVSENPETGEPKKGDLSGVYVHKFPCGGRLFLLAYEWDPETLLLLLVGVHENFYRNLKR